MKQLPATGVSADGHACVLKGNVLLRYVGLFEGADYPAHQGALTLVQFVPTYLTRSKSLALSANVSL
jgi:hypothetical protein